MQSKSCHNIHSHTPTKSKQFYTKSFKLSIFKEAQLDEPPRKRSKPNSSFNFTKYDANSMQNIHHASKYNANFNNNKNDNTMNPDNSQCVYITIKNNKICNNINATRIGYSDNLEIIKGENINNNNNKNKN